MQTRLSALLAAGGTSLAELDQELHDVLLPCSTAGDQLTLRVHNLQQRQQQQQQQRLKAAAGSTPASPSKAAAAEAGGSGSPQRAARQQAAAGAAALTPGALTVSALEDAECTVALLQAQLVSLSSKAAAGEARVAELQQRLTAAVVRRTREVAYARAAGEVQLATLQDAVSRLGQRDDMAGQVSVEGEGDTGPM
jgi:hypothetical protein